MWTPVAFESLLFVNETTYLNSTLKANAVLKFDVDITTEL